MLGNLQMLGAFLVVLGLVVFVHEFDHFAVAKLLGMRVFVFSFGFGRRLLGFTWGETDYRVSLLPLGGYVRLEGEPEDLPGGEDPSLTTRALSDGTLVEVENPDYFTNRPRWQRIFVYVAGPAMNAVLTIGLLTGFHMIGFSMVGASFDRPVVGALQPGSPAEAGGVRVGDLVVAVDGKLVDDWENAEYAVMIRPEADFKVRVQRADGEHELAVRSRAVTGKDRVQLGDLGWSPLVRVDPLPDGAARAAGLQSGDGILSIAGQPIRDFDQLVPIVAGSGGQPLKLVVWRAGQTFELTLAARQTPDGYKFGIQPTFVLKRFGFVRSLKESCLRAWTWTRQALETFARLATGRLSPKTLAGPIGIARASGDAAREGPFKLFFLVAYISLQVGILNLILPFVPFDGGHLALLLLESAMRRDLSERSRAWVMNAGLGMVLLLIVVVFYSDLSKISFFGRFLP